MKLTRDRREIVGCTKLGTVAGWEDLAKQNGAFWLAKEHGAYATGKAADVRVLYVDGHDDEAYLCGVPVGVRIRILADDSEAAGCTLVGTADESQPCPASYSGDRARCISWRALKMGGNVVVDAAPPRVYQCPSSGSTR